MIGIVISRPLELKIFDKEIRQKLKTAYLKGQRSKIDTLEKTYMQKYAMELGKNTDLKKEKDSLERDINRSRYQLNQEVLAIKPTKHRALPVMALMQSKSRPYWKKRKPGLNPLLII